MELNPRSFKSIREAMKSGQYRSRGELLRAMHNVFRKEHRSTGDGAAEKEKKPSTPSPSPGTAKKVKPN